MERVLVAMDDSEEARMALEHAFERFPEATVHVVHVPETSNFTFDFDSTITEEAQKRAETVLEEARTVANEYDRTIEAELVFGHAAEAVVSYADEHDIDQIITGSRGAEGPKRLLLGSVAETIVRRASCPVTVVR
ncbi:universal stress protein [Halobacteria archaeon AArc-m2/3/4]|uniref:Universal stress protein n=1 Tax=Natronoglomus mannanivorans TaxID=2979990 RepID=A0AAP3E3K0_9EURY|nr:universal stress protein [Halobacteria archaeon AArc-xg1-1]MCU4974807.1 universal stress protein [Halobacteria archaeon AArc-m2/3/4]